jgi:hypothetical protein
MSHSAHLHRSASPSTDLIPASLDIRNYYAEMHAQCVLLSSARNSSSFSFSPVLPFITPSNAHHYAAIEFLLDAIEKYEGDCTAVFRSRGTPGHVAWVLSRARSFFLALREVSFLSSSEYGAPTRQEDVSYEYSLSLGAPTSGEEPELASQRVGRVPPGPRFSVSYSINTEYMPGWSKYPAVSMLFEGVSCPTKDFYLKTFPEVLKKCTDAYVIAMNSSSATVRDTLETIPQPLSKFIQSNSAVDFICFAAVFGGIIQCAGEYFNRMLLDSVTSMLRVAFYRLGAYSYTLLDAKDWEDRFSHGLSTDPRISSEVELGSSGFTSGIKLVLGLDNSRNFIRKLTTDIFCDLSLERWNGAYEKEISGYLEAHRTLPTGGEALAKIQYIQDYPKQQLEHVDSLEGFSVVSQLQVFTPILPEDLSGTPLAYIAPILQQFNTRYPRYNSKDFGFNELCILNDYLLAWGYPDTIASGVRGLRSKPTPSDLKYLRSKSGNDIGQYTIAPNYTTLSIKQHQIDVETSSDTYWKINLINYLSFRMQNTTECNFFHKLVRTATEFTREKHPEEYKVASMFEVNTLKNISFYDYVCSLVTYPQLMRYYFNHILYEEFLEEDKESELQELLESDSTFRGLYTKLIYGAESIRRRNTLLVNQYIQTYKQELENALDSKVCYAENLGVVTDLSSPIVCMRDGTYSMSTESMAMDYILVSDRWISKAMEHVMSKYSVYIPSTNIATKISPVVSLTEKIKTKIQNNKKNLGRRPAYLFFKIPTEDATVPIHMIVIRHGKGLSMHLTGIDMEKCIQEAYRDITPVYLEKHKPISLDILFLPVDHFTRRHEQISRVLSPAVPWKYIGDICQSLAHYIDKSNWKQLSEGDTFTIMDGINGGVIPGVYGAHKFLDKYRDEIDPTFRRALQVYHSIKDPIESADPIKRKPGRPRKTFTNPQDAAVYEAKLKSSRKGAKRHTPAKIATMFSSLDDNYIKKYLRPRRSALEKYNLSQLCRGRSWDTIVARGLQLAEAMLDGGHFIIHSLPIVELTEDIQKRLVENLEKAIILKDDRVPLNLGMERLYATFTTYPKRLKGLWPSIPAPDQVD